MMRAFLEEVLAKDFTVQTFENGAEAMSFYETNEQPDVMLLDYEMEGMNGKQVLELMKSSGFYKDLPIVLLSGQKKSETRISCLALGAKDFITKPFHPQELVLRINNALN
jgi:DNA-binding response OmpR family regulator